MRQRDYSSVVTNAKLLVNKLMAQAIGASFIYASSDGMLRAHGHPAIVDVLTRHQDEILQHEAWTFGVGNRVAVDPAKCKETWHITGNINIASTYMCGLWIMYRGFIDRFRVI